MAREDGLVAFEHAQGRACMACDTECDLAETVRQDYQARIHAHTTNYRRSFDFVRVLMEHWFILSMQEADLE
jgi:hypothetical protein